MSQPKTRSWAPFGRTTSAIDPEALLPSRMFTALPELQAPKSTRTSVEKVLAAARAQSTPSPAAPVATEQPRFDDLTPYDVTETQEERLLELEVKRLFKAVKDLTAGLEFGHANLFPEPETKAAYEDLSKMADRILINLHICRYDNETVFQRFAEKKRDTDAYLNSRRILEDYLDKPEASEPLAPEATPTRQYVARYCALVDYVTAALARFAVSGIDNEEWQSRVLSGLARYSAKVKVLSRDPEEYSIRSLERGKRLSAEKRVMRAFGIDQVNLESDLAQRPANAAAMGMDQPRMMMPWSLHHQEHSKRSRELEAFLQKEEDPSENRHYSEMAIINTWTSSSLLWVFQMVRASSVSGHTADGFDICSVVYRAGTDDSPLSVFLHQDRRGEITGSSHLAFVKHVYQGFKLVQQAVATIPRAEVEEKAQDGFGGPSQRSGTRVAARLEEGGDQDVTAPLDDIPLTTLAEVVTVFVPLLCTMPTVVQEVQYALRQLGELLSIDVDEQLSPIAPDFTAVVSMRTRAFEMQSSSCLPEVDFRSLSRSLVVQPDRHASHPRAPAKTGVWYSLPAEQRKQRLQEIHQRQGKLTMAGREWDVAPRSVSVRCLQYVYTVLAICGALVVGGLMIGIFLGERTDGPLAGVDPFNITTFSWVVAGFFILIAKSVRVNEWPWRDFLLGRVTCRSLSELRAVTGANEQDLLLYLLTKESENVLITSGPYNMMFTRRGDSGFSIDLKPEVRTLLASGIIFVKCSMSDGSALVCLDLRRGSEKREVRTRIRHSDHIREDDLVCRYPPRTGDKIQDVELSKPRMGFFYFRCRRILGVYHSQTADRKVR